MLFWYQPLLQSMILPLVTQALQNYKSTMPHEVVSPMGLDWSRCQLKRLTRGTKGQGGGGVAIRGTNVGVWAHVQRKLLDLKFL
ncbi:unnamed protein product [Camellia sinensis]